ncbi:hypothetical protein E2C01_049341 [Portunus trituberculatus]|uniref:Uncharacterized protein n=1 Tax=Portunus trituberculatus TaxID=210409 RepID=A0A5B7GCW3_PORTR|nr:hypothetical protein [Portunus trituberculatus]
MIIHWEGSRVWGGGRGRKGREELEKEGKGREGDGEFTSPPLSPPSPIHRHGGATLAGHTRLERPGCQWGGRGRKEGCLGRSNMADVEKAVWQGGGGGVDDVHPIPAVTVEASRVTRPRFCLKMNIYNNLPHVVLTTLQNSLGECQSATSAINTVSAPSRGPDKSGVMDSSSVLLYLVQRQNHARCITKTSLHEFFNFLK